MPMKTNGKGIHRVCSGERVVDERVMDLAIRHDANAVWLPARCVGATNRCQQRAGIAYNPST
jgi:hypothetical protein